jgi:hypothetical protein
MPRSVFAPLDRAVETDFTPRDGISRPALMTAAVTIFETGEDASRFAMPLRQLIQKYRDPETGDLSFPMGSKKLTMDPASLSEFPDSALATVGFRAISREQVERGWVPPERL